MLLVPPLNQYRSTATRTWPQQGAEKALHPPKDIAQLAVSPVQGKLVSSGVQHAEELRIARLSASMNFESSATQ